MSNREGTLSPCRFLHRWVHNASKNERACKKCGCEQRLECVADPIDGGVICAWVAKPSNQDNTATEGTP